MSNFSSVIVTSFFFKNYNFFIFDLRQNCSLYNNIFDIRATYNNFTFFILVINDFWKLQFCLCKTIIFDVLEVSGDNLNFFLNWKRAKELSKGIWGSHFAGLVRFLRFWDAFWGVGFLKVFWSAKSRLKVWKLAAWGC